MNRTGFSLLVTLALVLGVLATRSSAANYTYTPTSTSVNTTDSWNATAGWDAKPVSNSTTTLVFGTAGTPAAFFTAAGVVINSDNDLPDGELDANGRFQLNNLTAGFAGTASQSASTVNMSGKPLQFLADGSTNPVIAFRADRNGSNATTKPILILSNDIYLGASEITITSNTNAGGGNNAGNVRLTGAFGFSTTGLHTVNLGGNGSAASNLSGRAIFAGNIGDSGTGGAGNATTLTKASTSFWDLTGAVTHSGGTTVSAGVLRTTQATGLGTGNIAVASGAAVWLYGGGTYGNNFSIAGNGPSITPSTVGVNPGALVLQGTTNGTITLTGDARISATNSNSTSSNGGTIAGKITGAFALTFGNGAGVQQGPLVISNPLNDWTGGTTFSGENRAAFSGNSGATQTFRLGASEVIPHGAGKGDVLMFNGGQADQTLDLAGFNETINGLNSGGNGQPARRIIRNGVVGTSVLTVGDNDANGSFLGTMNNGNSTAVLALTKVGAGTQTLTGTSSFTGNTTVSGGTLKIDYSIWGSSKTATPANYLGSASGLVVGGGATFAIEGRTSGAASETTGVAIASGAVDFYLPNAVASTLRVGQEVTLEATAGGNGTSQLDAETYITRFGASNATHTLVQGDESLANFNYTATARTAATSASTSQTLASLTLSGAADTTATIDFGSSDNVVLTINSAPTQTNDGSKLVISNWSGTPVTGGGAERLMFTGNSTAFSSVFSQGEVSFDGYGSGYVLVQGATEYEVTAIPEPSLLGMVLAGGILLRLRRRRSA